MDHEVCVRREVLLAVFVIAPVAEAIEGGFNKVARLPGIDCHGESDCQ